MSGTTVEAAQKKSQLVPMCYWELIRAYNKIVGDCSGMPPWLTLFGYRFIPLFPAQVVNYFVNSHIEKRLQLLKNYFRNEEIKQKSEFPQTLLKSQNSELDEASSALDTLSASLPEIGVNKWVGIFLFLVVVLALIYVTNLISPLSPDEVNATLAVATSIYASNGGDLLKSLLDQNLFSVLKKMIVPLFCLTYASSIVIYYFDFKRWLFNHPTKCAGEDCSVEELWQMGVSKKTGVYALEKRVFGYFNINPPFEWQLDLVMLIIMDLAVGAILAYSAKDFLLVWLSPALQNIYLGNYVIFFLCAVSLYVIASWWWGRRNDVDIGEKMCKLKYDLQHALPSHSIETSPEIHVQKTLKQKTAQVAAYSFPVATLVAGVLFVTWSVFTVILRNLTTKTSSLVQGASGTPLIDQLIRSVALLVTLSVILFAARQEVVTIRHRTVGRAKQYGRRVRKYSHKSQKKVKDLATDTKHALQIYQELPQRRHVSLIETARQLGRRFFKGWITTSEYEIRVRCPLLQSTAHPQITARELVVECISKLCKMHADDLPINCLRMYVETERKDCALKLRIRDFSENSAKEAHELCTLMREHLELTPSELAETAPPTVAITENY